jgi:EAL domain-containing protein (putative c-di-GMP-specific phosphodiesterase class I)
MTGEMDVDALLRDADVALYTAKALGGDRVELFASKMRRTRLQTQRMEMDLRGAAGRGELRLEYQPVVDLSAMRTVGVEALLRWDRPQEGLLSAGRFIEMAEDTGAIIDIGRWVLEEACRALQRLAELPWTPAGFYVTVNLSRRQLLAPDIVDMVVGTTGRLGCDPAGLVLEVTETALVSDTPTLVRRLAELRHLGHSIAMDDFGMGYSSLDQLRALPIDVLKIDRSFVSGIDVEQDAFVLASAIVRLAGGLGKRTIAEGVETPGQLAHLRAMGVRLAQGYLFGRPMPEEDLLARLHREAGDAVRRS